MRKEVVKKGRRLIRSLSFPTIALALCALMIFCSATPASNKEDSGDHPHLFLSSEDYHDEKTTDLSDRLEHRIEIQPFNLISLIFFICAIVHTFFTQKFTAIAHKLEMKRLKQQNNPKSKELLLDEDGNPIEEDKCFKAEIFHFLGEVEAVFIIWAIPMILSMALLYDWHTAVEYVQSRSYIEPMFVVVIMSISATRPIVNFAESCLTVVAKIGSEKPAAWWLTILTVGPLLGSIITEPAAMTLCAMLLTKQFFRYDPSPIFKYATLGLLFTNISVGGVLTHFAAPPVLMVSDAWGWGTPYMASNFGWKAVIGIIIANTVYYLRFRKEFPKIAKERALLSAAKKASHISRRLVPTWITFVHLLMLGWIVFTNHYPTLFIGGFLLFLAFYQATMSHQNLLILRGPILVGCFLAGLLIHGGMQVWWISAVLQKVNEGALMISAIALTAFNDNAAITYLSTLVPGLTDTMKYSIVAGAVAGGGLTVIANAPNPAGFSILGPHFEDGISPLGLFLAALTPTIIVSSCLAFL